MENDPESIAEFVSTCALNAVRTQEVLDAGPRVNPLTPAMQILEFEMDAELALTVRRDISFEIRVSPLNLGYRISHQDTSAADARITVSVVRIPNPDLTGRQESSPDGKQISG